MVIAFYQTQSGRSPVVDYLRKLPLDERVEIDAVIEDLTVHGIDAPLVSMRHIIGKLWELRIFQTRIFYVMVKSNRMVLLHAYKKQGQKSPKNEIETARKRMAFFL